MEEMKKPPFETDGWTVPPAQLPAEPAIPFEKREWHLALALGILGIAMCDFIFYGGFYLGFALTAVASILCAAVYLLRAGKRLDWYSAALLVSCMVITAGFGRSDDGFVKFVMVCFVLVGVNLALCLLSGQNRRSPAGAASLLDAPRAALYLGMGKLPGVFRGFREAHKKSGDAGRKSSAAVLGMVIALPLILVVGGLLIQADAAFEGFVGLLPEIEWSEPVCSVVFCLSLALVLYTRTVALHHSAKPDAALTKTHSRLSAITVNIVLGGVCLVYLVYLCSQLAYISGGLSGILPEEFTMAEYARRGFFEMAWLCLINLTVICLSVWLVEKQEKAPAATRVMCLILGAVSLFLVITASAKMGMYIGAYGLTRLRVLTEVIMVFLGLATALVCAWLFCPKLPYMKLIMVAALVIGALVLWVDVDTVVAAYNVTAYQAGKLSGVDVSYLATLSDGAIPYIARLVKDADPQVADTARTLLERFSAQRWHDFRDWNYASAMAQQVLQDLLGG